MRRLLKVLPSLRARHPNTGANPAELPKTLFSEEEVARFFRIDTNETKRAGSIRGPIDKWSVRGDVLCGHHTSINGPFKAYGRVRIGNYCSFGEFVGLNSGNHRTDMANQQIWFSQRFDFKIPTESRGPIEIGHNVWIGDKATLLSGVRVGHGSVIGAGATVKKSVEHFTIVAGTPARVLRKRFTENVIKQLLEIRWWNWDDERVRRNRKFFELEIPAEDEVDLLGLVKD